MNDDWDGAGELMSSLMMEVATEVLMKLLIEVVMS